MRRVLLALPFALLPLAFAQAHDDHEHGSLGAHEHGTAHLNVALSEHTLELGLDSPAMNLIGFEHAASSDADKAKVAAARELLENPLVLFMIPAAAKCTMTKQGLQSPLFGNASSHEEHDANGHQHADVDAKYQFECDNPAALKALDLSNLFKTFPATQKVEVQMIGPSGQNGVEATPSNNQVKF